MRIQGYSYTVSSMKTTFDLPEELVLQAKKVALSRKTTLRSLVLRGLQRELQSPTPEFKSQIATLLAVDTAVWANVSPDSYVQTLRENWT